MADTDWLVRAVREAGGDLDAHGGIADLARRTGLTRQTISKILSGETEPTIHSCRGLAQALEWSTLAVMQAFRLLGPEDLQEPGKGPWKPHWSRVQHFESAESSLLEAHAALAHFAANNETLTLMACAHTHAILASIDTSRFPYEEQS